MLIWLIRHGCTELTEARKYQGVLDTPLSEEGRRTLKQAAFSPALVYTSGLKRTQETAAVLFPSAKQIPIPELGEMNFGLFEGRRADEMTEDPAYRAWVDGFCLGRCPDGEDRASFSDRICTAFSALVDKARAAGEEQLVVVAHAGTQMAVLERWGRPGRDYYAGAAKPGAGYVLSSELWPEALEITEEIGFTK